MDITLSMPEEEYEKQLWLLNALGSLQDKAEKTASSSDIKEILAQNDESPYIEENLKTEEVEERLNHLSRIGLVKRHRNTGNWILDTLGLNQWD